MGDPEVSVVVAARNEEDHLAACLGSVRRQRGVEFECIVVDDGSTDATLSLATRMARRDSRFRVLRHEEARGLAGARNHGTAEAVAPWVTFLDGDDFLFPGALRARVERLRNAPSDIIGCYGDWVSVPEWCPPIPVRRRAAARKDIWMVTAARAVPFIASAPIVSRQLVVDLGGFDESLFTAEDADFWQWWLRLMAKTVYTPTLSVGYRRRAGSMTRRDLAAHFRANRDAFEGFDEMLDAAPSAVLGNAESHYRAETIAEPRAGLAAAFAIADGNVGTAEAILSEIDPVVLRMLGPRARAEAAAAGAVRRTRGTKGAKPLLGDLATTRGELDSLYESLAAPTSSFEELREAAKWLAMRRRAPSTV